VSEEATEHSHDRNAGVLTPTEQEMLRKSRVVVAGVGGVGGRVSETLARLGVGELIVIDPDVFTVTNLNRQAGSSVETLDQKKADVIASLCRAVSPAAVVSSFPVGVDSRNVESLVDGADVVVDGTDYSRPETALVLAREARRQDIPVVLAVEVGFGGWVTAFHPKGVTFERFFRLSESVTDEEVKRGDESIPLERWIGRIPRYADTRILEAIRKGELEAPAIAPAVEICAATVSTLVVDILSGRNSLWAPTVWHVDVRERRALTYRPSTWRIATSALLAGRGRRWSIGTGEANGKRDINGSPTNLPHVDPAHVPFLRQILRAPSAHNAQPWAIVPLGDGSSYEIHYLQTADLPRDHDDKDAYLTMGAFIETMELEAPNFGLLVEINPRLTRQGDDLHIATVTVASVEHPESDPLSLWVSARTTNRGPYMKGRLPDDLAAELEALGNVLIDPEKAWPIVLEASTAAWRDSQYVQDLQNWFRNDDAAADGITPSPFRLDKASVLALRFAFRRGGFRSSTMARLYALAEVRAFRVAPRAVVVHVDDMTPRALFEAGRRLLRSWVVIASHGYDYQPFSVAVDNRDAAAKLAELAEVKHAVALYRVGKGNAPSQGTSNRKPLEQVLLPPD
jgi:molybdopterin/thiamine biosynthesis adenylyltransferase